LPTTAQPHVLRHFRRHLERLDLGQPSTLPGAPPAVSALGFGFGGISYDSALDSFWTIGPVNNASSQLFDHDVRVGVCAVGTLGDGFGDCRPVGGGLVPDQDRIAGRGVWQSYFWISRKNRGILSSMASTPPLDSNSLGEKNYDQQTALLSRLEAIGVFALSLRHTINTRAPMRDP